MNTSYKSKTKPTMLEDMIVLAPEDIVYFTKSSPDTTGGADIVRDFYTVRLADERLITCSYPITDGKKRNPAFSQAIIDASRFTKKLLKLHGFVSLPTQKGNTQSFINHSLVNFYQPVVEHIGVAVNVNGKSMQIGMQENMDPSSYGAGSILQIGFYEFIGGLIKNGLDPLIRTLSLKDMIEGQELLTVDEPPPVMVMLHKGSPQALNLRFECARAEAEILLSHSKTIRALDVIASTKTDPATTDSTTADLTVKASWPAPEERNEARKQVVKQFQSSLLPKNAT